MDRLKTMGKGVGRRIGSLLALLFFLPAAGAAAGADFSLHGFVQGNYSSSIAGSNPDGGDFKWAEERIQLKLDGSKESFHFLVKTDALYDHLDRKSDLELREGYVDYTAGSWDLRAGRQIITWGLGDLLFINDVFPKDYEAFFSGRPLEYMKKGIDGVKAGIYPAFASFEIVVIPFFEPNHFPDSGRFRMFDPLRGITNRSREKPPTTLENTEVAVRVYRDVLGFDTSLYFYRGFFRQPSAFPDNLAAPASLMFLYPELNVYGASAQGRALGGVVSLEAGYYDSRQDRSGKDPLIPNSQARFLLGYQRQLWEDGTLGLQYYAEYMRDHSAYEETLPPGFPKERKIRHLTSARFTQFFLHQTLRLSFFSFYSPTEGDYLLNPEAKYNFTDRIWAALGVMAFGGGEPWSQFGQLDRNDNLYLQMRYEF
ncbi:MAG: hypothetical protein IT388_00890 [Nitrospirales bacterium]|nr:hypothetical protein [Nitrospirales bacterium]